MKNRLMCALGACVAGAGLALAQAPEFKPARSFTLDAPGARPVAPRRAAPQPPPAPAPVQALYQEMARPTPKPTIKPASEAVYQPMPSDPSTPVEMPVQIPVAKLYDFTGPVEVTDSSAADAVDGGVFTEGAVPCGCGDGCRAWVAADALMWWLNDSPIAVPLGTTGTTAGNGVIGQPDTAFINGGNADLDTETRFGARFMFGYWVNDAMAIEAGGFFLSQGGTSFFQTATPNASGTNTVLARPYFNAATGSEAAVLIAAPGLADGRFDLTHTNRLWGLELNTHLAVLCQQGLRINLIAGARYVDLHDDLTLRSISGLTGNGVLLLNALPLTSPEQLIIQDTFTTRNRWMGGQLGVQTGIDCGAFFLNGTFKVGAGVNKQELVIAGSSSNNNFFDNGGFFALPSNIGTFGRNRWSFLNETVAEVGYRLNDWAAVSAGYTFLYLTGVVRAGNQLERTINGSTIPSQIGFNSQAQPQLPRTQMDQSDFWAHGVQLSLSLRF